MGDSPKFNCGVVDKHFEKILKIIDAYFVAKKIRYEIKEERFRDIFVYFISNLDKGLEGFVAKDSKTGRLVYIVMDKARIKWAQSEGFVGEKEDPKEAASRKVGIYIKVGSINGFLNFMIGDKDYKFDGEYTKTDA